MTLRTYLPILIIAFCLANTINSCHQLENNRKTQVEIGKNIAALQNDSSKTAIILFDQKKLGYPFDSTYKPATLTQQELNRVDSFLIACAGD